MTVALYIIGILALLSIASHIIWGRSLWTTGIALLTRLINIEAKFKDDEKTTRQKIEAMEEKPYVLPKNLKLHTALRKTTICGMPAFYMNEHSGSNRLLFYVHGGGFVKEIMPIHWRFLDKMAQKTGSEIIIPLYPLAPFHTYKDTFPAIIDVYKQTFKENSGKKMVLMGDSAGGNICTVIAEHLTKTEQPDELILLSPAVDMNVSPDDPKEVDAFRKCTLVGVEAALVLGEYWAGSKENMVSPWVSPISGDFSNLKRVTIIIGERDMAYAMGIRLGNKLKSAGIDTTIIVGRGMNHVWPLQPVPEAKRAQKIIAELVMRESDNPYN